RTGLLVRRRYSPGRVPSCPCVDPTPVRPASASRLRDPRPQSSSLVAPRRVPLVRCPHLPRAPELLRFQGHAPPAAAPSFDEAPPVPVRSGAALRHSERPLRDPRSFSETSLDGAGLQFSWCLSRRTDRAGPDPALAYRKVWQSE